MSIWPALAILSCIVRLFAWCAFAVSASCDDDPVALKQLAARQHANKQPQQPMREGRGVVGRVHGQANYNDTGAE